MLFVVHRSLTFLAISVSFVIPRRCEGVGTAWCLPVVAKALRRRTVAEKRSASEDRATLTTKEREEDANEKRK